MSVIHFESGIDERSPSERFKQIWSTLGETALSPLQDFEATMNAIRLAGDLTVDPSQIVRQDLLSHEPELR